MVHFLLNVSQENSFSRLSGQNNAALKMMLARKPQVDLLDLEERSPLIRCINDGLTDAAEMLVSEHLTNSHNSRFLHRRVV